METFGTGLPGPVWGAISLTKNICVGKNIGKSGGLRVSESCKFMILEVNGVAVGRHGPILRENEATGARKVFRYPRGLRDTIKKSKKVVRTPKSKKSAFCRIF